MDKIETELRGFIDHRRPMDPVRRDHLVRRLAEIARGAGPHVNALDVLRQRWDDLDKARGGARVDDEALVRDLITEFSNAVRKP